MRARPHTTLVLPALLLVLFASVPFAFAQTGKPKKGAKPDASASASAAASAAAPSSAPTPDPTPAAAPPDTAAASASAAGPQRSAADSALSSDDPSDVREDPNQKYYFIGIRYRLAIVPQAFESLFVDDGGTFVSHAIGAEFDIRKDGHSTIPWIQFQTLGFGDTLFHQKGKTGGGLNDVDNRSVVNSGVNLFVLGLDQLWSIPMVEPKLDYELGFGVGIAFVLGSLTNDWVYNDATGPLVDGQGHHYSRCINPGDGSDGSCVPAAHSNSQQNKINHYVEPNWFNGGSIPQPFFHLALQPVGFRYKPTKFLQVRFGVGLQITGVFFNLAVDYGLEQQLNKGNKTSRTMLPGDRL
jgi:hypothetical protein